MMMLDLGRHAVPVLSAWGISGALVLGLIAQTIAANTRARKALEKVEGRG